MESKEKLKQGVAGIIIITYIAFFVGLFVGGSITRESCIAYKEPYKTGSDF